MFKRNKIVYFLLAVMLLNCYIPKAESAASDFWLKSFGYYDSEGEKLTALVGGADIVLKATVKKLADGQKDATLIAEFFKDGEIFDLKSQTVHFSEIELEKTVSIPYTLPSNVTGFTIEAYLWDTYQSQAPIARFSTFGSAIADIDKISIYGKQVSEFNSSTENYNLILPASTGNNILLDYLCGDMATNVEAVRNGQQLQLVSLSSGGVSKTYTIDFTLANPEVISDELIYYDANGTQQTGDGAYQFPAVHELKLPVYQRDADGKVIKFGTTANFNNGVSRVYDKMYYFYYKLPDELVGASYLFTGRLRDMDFDNMTVKLKLNKSATVYFSASEEIAEAQNATEYDKFNQIKIISAGNSGSEMRDFVPNLNAEGSGLINGELYKKRFEVPEGAEYKEFVLSVGNSDYNYAPAVIIKFDD